MPTDRVKELSLELIELCEEHHNSSEFIQALVWALAYKTACKGHQSDKISEVTVQAYLEAIKVIKKAMGDIYHEVN